MFPKTFLLQYHNSAILILKKIMDVGVIPRKNKVKKKKSHKCVRDASDVYCYHR